MKSLGRVFTTIIIIVLVLAMIWMSRGFFQNVWPSWWGWILDKLP